MSDKKQGENPTYREDASKKKKGGKKILLRIVLVLIVLLLGSCIFWKVAPGSVKDSIYKELSRWPAVRSLITTFFGDDIKGVQDENFNESNIHVNEEVYEKLDLTGYTNIVLFGIDARGSEFDEDTRSDSMIILSINNDTNEMRLVSLYRDTMLRSGSEETGIHYDKCNAAYARGGAEEAINMINTNLDLNISDYAVINFSGLAKIIDELGGVRVTLTEDELDLINNTYLPGLRKFTKTDTPPVAHAGKVKLTGVQAVAYCRIRYVTYYSEDGKEYDFDLGRTARQRAIITKLVKKAKRLPIGELMSLSKKILNMNTPEETYFKTSLQTEEILDLIPTMIDYNISGATGFPFTLDFVRIDGAEMVIPAGLTYNVKLLHRFLFDDSEYEPSSVVEDIGWSITNRSGVNEHWLLTEEEDALSPSYIPPETEAETGTGTETETETESETEEE